jgi:hypothetical protein
MSVTAELDGRSDALELGDGPFVIDITCIECGFGLDEKQVDFLVGSGTMLDAFRHDYEFAGVDHGFVIAEFHAKCAFDDQKQLVFVIVMMEDKLALEFDGFNVSVVEFTDDAWVEVIGESTELVTEVYGFHESPRSATSLSTFQKGRELLLVRVVQRFLRLR